MEILYFVAFGIKIQTLEAKKLNIFNLFSLRTEQI